MSKVLNKADQIRYINLQEEYIKDEQRQAPLRMSGPSEYLQHAGA